jgi:hypothetical protein
MREMKPEEKARQKIDKMLETANGILRSMK